ncbi:hypothetical protein QQF64_030267 [Cirrhinus molitorella]|uniref:Uncharacterized protein n=1 Tax=Cirrhinus molitorella TaxID=172907 RepID=A0ABR3N360_9TELE
MPLKQFQSDVHYVAQSSQSAYDSVAVSHTVGNGSYQTFFQSIALHSALTGFILTCHEAANICNFCDLRFIPYIRVGYNGPERVLEQDWVYWPI